MRIDPANFYRGMNASVLRANQMHDDRARAFAANEDAERSSALEDRSFARSMAERQFGQQGQQFDARLNLLRELLSRRAPDFYGGGGEGGQGAPARGGWAATIGGQAPRRQGGFLPFGADEETGAPVNNMLARFLGR